MIRFIDRVPHTVIILGCLWCSLEVSAFAESSADARIRFKSLEKVSIASIPIRFSLGDRRTQQDVNLPIKPLEDSICRALRSIGIAVVSGDSLSPLRPMAFHVEFSYFGFYVTEWKKWGVKTIALLEGSDDGTPPSQIHVPITVNHLYGRFDAKKAEDWGRTLAAETVAQVTRNIESALNPVARGYREIVTFGEAPNVGAHSRVRTVAVADALRKTCAIAWGLKIQATTEIVDLAEVTDRIREEGGCRILEYGILDPYTVTTSDGFVFVVVRAVTAKQ